jgi:putative endonuclease
MATQKNNNKGKQGEDFAVKYLERKGYIILERNWRDGHKELDIIAQLGDVVVFVEVKSRYGEDAGLPEEGMSKSKIKQLLQAAETYMFVNKILEVRFDFIGIIFHENKKAEIHHVEAAL